VSGVVVLIIVMAGCGTALALLNKGSLTVSGGVNTGVPSPSPAGSASPIASPSVAASATSATNDSEVVAVPQGWSVQKPDTETIVLTNPNGDGAVIIASGAMNPRQSAQQDKDSYQAYLLGKYPDLKDCPGSQTTTGTLAGASGIFWTLCFIAGTGANKFPAAAAMFMGANSEGSLYYLVVRETNKDNLSAFVAQAAPVVQGIQWKLK
jgi:hypothetical protein